MSLRFIVSEASNNRITTHRSWGSELVHIYVGRRVVPFSVHKKLLCSTSVFFDNAFNTGSEAAAQGEMTLPDDQAYVFQGFVNWLYARKLGDLAPDGGPWNMAELVDLYLFAMEKCSNAFQNAVMDGIQDHLDRRNNTLSPELVSKIYINTRSTQDASIRKFCCACITWFLDHPETNHGWDEMEAKYFLCWDSDNYYDLQIEIYDSFETRVRFSPLKRNASELYCMCYFHIHADGEECKSVSQYKPYV